MTSHDEVRVVSAGNANLAHAPAGQRVRGGGEVFAMTPTKDGVVRKNHVVEFDEGRRIAWRPAEPGRTRRGTCGGGSWSRPAAVAEQ